MAGNRRFSRKRFGALAMHIANRLNENGCLTLPHFFVTLWLADTSSYAKLGKSLTGVEYMKGMLYPLPVKPPTR